MNIRCLRLAAVGVLWVPFLAAQSADDTQLKQVILFGRHGVRTPNLPNSILNNFSTQPFPVFSDVPGNPTDNQPAILTMNGAANETILGSYYRLWLTQEGLLTGDDSADAAGVYVRAAASPLIIGTAQAFVAGLLPAAQVNVDSYPATANDPLFSPVAAGVAQLDENMAVAAVNGRLGVNPQALATTYASELSLTRSLLFGYSVNQTPAPPVPAGKIDVTQIPVGAVPGNPTLPVDLGGLTQTAYAIDPFVMEYEDGLPDSQVGWGQLTAGGISQLSRLRNILLDLEFRTPYLARVQSSNMASHIVRSLVQAASGMALPGTLGNPASKIIVVIGSDTNITGLAGLFHLDWLVPGDQADVCEPDGVLMFELRQSQSSGEYIVRTTYLAQTMDQLRNRTALTLDAPPASAPVFIPGCSTENATFDCALNDLVKVAQRTVDQASVDLIN